jgi:TatD DNase family protein
MIDTHAHIYVDRFKNDIDEVIERAKKVGISAICLPNIDQKSIDPMLQLASAYPSFCHPMIGLHPCSVEEDYKDLLDRMEPMIQENDIIGIGETGIDLYWDSSTKELQIDAFRIQLEWALKYNLPIVIHSRKSLDLSIELVSEYQNGNLKGIFHCFDGTVRQAKKIGSLGFYMGIGGILTYKNSGLKEIIPEIDINSIVLETDAPYLPPQAYRGKRNESSYMTEVARKLAGLYGIRLSEVSEITTTNAYNIFGIL